MKDLNLFRIYRILFVFGFILLIENNGLCQTLTFTGTAPTFTLNAGTPGGALTSASDQTVRLNYSTPANPNPATYRITVSTNNTTPKYTLTVVAVSPTRGTAEAAVTLNSSTATNLITAIPRNKAGRCNLLYTASADFVDGVGTDTHTITYTLLQP